MGLGCEEIRIENLHIWTKHVVATLGDTEMKNEKYVRGQMSAHAVVCYLEGRQLFMFLDAANTDKIFTDCD